MILGFPRAKQGLPLWHKSGGGDPSLICYSSKTAEQNFMKLSGIVHYMMPYCTSYFKFLSACFLGVPQQNKDFAITTYGGGGDPSLIRYSSKTAEQNFMKPSGIVHYMMQYWPVLKFYSNDYGVSQSKTRTRTKHGGAWGIILWALLTVYLVILGNWISRKDLITSLSINMV